MVSFLEPSDSATLHEMTGSFRGVVGSLELDYPMFRSGMTKANGKAFAALSLALLPPNTIRVWVDGCRLGRDSTGPAGVGVFAPPSRDLPQGLRLAVPLPVATSSSAETAALGIAAKVVRAEIPCCSDRLVAIIGDCHNVQEAVAKPTRRRSIALARSELAALASALGRTPRLVWVPGHVGISGNEIAHTLARKAADRAKREAEGMREIKIVDIVEREAATPPPSPPRGWVTQQKLWDNARIAPSPEPIYLGGGLVYL